MKNNNYYELLGITQDANLAEITSAYENKLDKLSPENFRGHRQFANAQIKLLKKAYNVLKNSAKKKPSHLDAPPPETISVPTPLTQNRSAPNIKWRGFYSDTNIQLMLAAAKAALEAANNHSENYPFPITQYLSGSPRQHSQQAESLQAEAKTFLSFINNKATPNEVIRDEYLKFIKIIERISADPKPNPLAKDLRTKNILDTLSQSISFTLFNKSTPRLVTPIKKSLNTYVDKITTKLKVPKPRKRP